MPGRRPKPRRCCARGRHRRRAARRGDETEDAGLRLVRFCATNWAIGPRASSCAPASPATRRNRDDRLYDINDYKTKSELTRVRLYTSITVAIRLVLADPPAGGQPAGLEMIVNATMELSRPRGLRRFAEGVTQLCAVLGIGGRRLVCAAASVAGFRLCPRRGRALLGMDRPVAGQHSRRSGPARAGGMHWAKRQHSFRKNRPACISRLPGNHPPPPSSMSITPERCRSQAAGGLLQQHRGRFLENVQLYQKVMTWLSRICSPACPTRNSFIGLIGAGRPRPTASRWSIIDGFSDINSILDQAFRRSGAGGRGHPPARAAFPLSVAVARVGSDVFGFCFGGAGGDAGADCPDFPAPFPSMARSCACRPPAA